MPFKPNYQQQKAERARAKALKKQEKQQRLEEQSSRRHEDAAEDAAAEAPDANKDDGEGSSVESPKSAAI
jgi:hypothetical protein